MNDLQEYLASAEKTVDRALDEILQGSGRIFDAMKYSLLAGGKRIRPVLCIAAAEAVGGKADDVLPTACAIEMIHTYSLIHDDLPAMDNDSLRRGKPTCHMAFDEATAILAGDALLTFAFQILSKPCSKPERALTVLNRISQAAGYMGMIEGQMRDISSEGVTLERKALENIHKLKTGALIEASVYSGAVLGGGTPVQVEKLLVYAENTGLAFQVADDILNVEGDPTVMGKAVGTDEARNKNTYPSILGLDKSRDLAKRLVENASGALGIFGNKARPLYSIARYIIERKR